MTGNSIFESPRDDPPRVSRRGALRIGMASTALLALTGCGLLGGARGSEAAYKNLADTLDALAASENQRALLRSISRRITNRCREIQEEHDEFRIRFDALSRDRDISASELEQLVEGFSARRVQHRSELLYAQDELRVALGETEWKTAIRALNRTKRAFSRSTTEGGV
jgi:hypothetical protein